MGVDRGRRLSRERRDPRAPGAVPPAPVELEFRGRAEELEQVRMALRALAAGVPARQLIVGEQGIGKSRLVAEALSKKNLDGMVMYTGRALELEPDRPFGVLIDALDLRPDSEHAEQAEIGRLIAFATRRNSDAEQRHEVAQRIAELVERLTDVVPIALVLEDMQWADRFSVMALARVLADCNDCPLGVFLTRRVLPSNAAIDDVLDDGRPPFARIDLEALDPEVIALLAHDFLGAAPGVQLQQQIDGVGGNPSLLLALLHGWQQAGQLRRHDDVVETATVSPPQEMRPAVLGRVARLTDRCHDLLTVAAVFERPFGVAMLAAVAGRSVIDVLTDLREAIAARLVLEVAGVLSFRHELVRQIVYDATPAAVRAELHRQIADALRSDRASPALVGHHQLRAAELSRIDAAAQWPAGPAERTSLRWDLLTPTERQVALLVAHGLSNKQAGARLQISARTIETHLAHVFAKLGINSRVELAGAVGRAGIAATNGHATSVRDTGETRDITGRPQTRQPRGVLPN